MSTAVAAGIPPAHGGFRGSEKGKPDPEDADSRRRRNTNGFFAEDEEDEEEVEDEQGVGEAAVRRREEEEEEQEHKKILKGKDLQFSEYRKTNTITSCPVCRKTRTWQWNNSLTHAINQVKRSNNTELSKKCHGWLLHNHGFKF